MRRALHAMALSLVFVPVGLAVIASWAESTVLIRRIAAGGLPLAVENLSNAISSGTVTSATTTITTTADTTLVVLVIAYRRNSSQSVTAVTLNGVDMTLSTQTSSAPKRIRIEYYENPGAGTFDMAVTMSASVPGFAMRALSFTGATVAPFNDQATVGSVTTSTLTFTTQSGDLVITGLTKQDPATSEPNMNSPDTTIWHDADYSSSGNGGHFKIAVSSATGTSKDVNYSWTSAANHAFAGAVLR